jgi:hypothetical protein
MRVGKREFAWELHQSTPEYAPVERREQELHDGVHDSWLDITGQTSKISRRFSSKFEPAGKLTRVMRVDRSVEAPDWRWNAKRELQHAVSSRISLMRPLFLTFKIITPRHVCCTWRRGSILFSLIFSHYNHSKFLFLSHKLSKHYIEARAFKLQVLNWVELPITFDIFLSL